MATYNFPYQVAPSSRSFEPGEYPQNVFESQNGSKTIIRYGNKAVNAKMTLGFTNVSDSDAYKIMNSYFDVNKDWSTIKFTDTRGLQGIEDPFIRDLIETGIGGESATKWRYSAPPSITSVQPGINNVSCSFVACLDGD